MNNSLSSKTLTIGWNGVRVEVPAHWETIVSGHNHLIFEDDFKPVFQIRWKKIGVLDPQKFEEKSDLWWHQLGTTSDAVLFPPELSTLADSFTHSRYYRGRQPMASGGICYSAENKILLFFQQLNNEEAMWQKTAEVLSSLSWHGFIDTLWQIQDFTLTTSTEYTLTDYSFKAGLSRLSFKGNNCNLQICRLGQASHRLKSQSLEDILFTLVGTRQLPVTLSSGKKICSGVRSPSVTRQVLHRMKKEKPFINAKVWLVPEHDRLLAYVASSTRPISPEGVTLCYETFKII